MESTGRSSGGAIDLVMAETGRDFGGAVRFLQTELQHEDIIADAAFIAVQREGARVTSEIKKCPVVGIEEHAPAAPNRRDVIRTHLAGLGASAEIVEAAIKDEALEATQQGNRIFCRWSMRNPAGEVVGYGLTEADARPFSALRGSPGVCAFDADPTAALLHGDMRRQFWVAPSPVDAMAAISACRRLDIPALKPSIRAEVVATFGVDKDRVSDVVERVTRSGAETILCAPTDAASTKFAEMTRVELNNRGAKVRDLGWVLRAVDLDRWTRMAENLAKSAADVVAKIGAVWSNRARPTPAKGKGSGL